MSQLSLRISHRSAAGFHLHVDTALALRGVTALFGPSGSGKTTLLDCIAGLRPEIKDATVSFDEVQWQHSSLHTPPWKRSLGYVFQDARLFPHMSVAGNLDFAERHASGKGFERGQVIEWLGIDALLERAPEALSAGQQQRVAIARALLCNPQLLLLDEPLANLDREAAQACLACLARISRDTDLPMIYVSHQIEEVSSIADSIVFLAEGRVQAQGPLLELASRLDTQLAADDAAAALLRAEVIDSDTKYGLTHLRVDAQTLWVSGLSPPGNELRLRVPARDVSVCRERPSGSSILNILPVTLRETRELSQAHCLLRLQLDTQYLLARITRKSQDELALKPGDQLFAQIKSTALLGDTP